MCLEIEYRLQRASSRYIPRTFDRNHNAVYVVLEVVLAKSMLESSKAPFPGDRMSTQNIRSCILWDFLCSMWASILLLLSSLKVGCLARWLLLVQHPV